jgi:carbon storage regulator
MLILTRRIKEEIIINKNISIMILGIDGGQVRLGFEAPKDVTINRKEIQDKIDSEAVDCNLIKYLDNDMSGNDKGPLCYSDKHGA